MDVYLAENSDWGQDASTGGSRVNDEDSKAIWETMHSDWLHDRVHGPTVEYVESQVLSEQCFETLPEDIEMAAHCASVALALRCNQATGRDISEAVLNEWRQMIMVGMAMMKANTDGDLSFGEKPDIV